MDSQATHENHETQHQQIEPSQSHPNSSQHLQNPQLSDQNNQHSQPEIVDGPEKPPDNSEPPLPAAVASASAVTEPLREGQIVIQQHHNAYYPQNFMGLGGDQQNFGFPGLNPAAAAAATALLQLTQFAGNMGDVERAMAELQGLVAAGYGAFMGGGPAGPFTGQVPMHYAPISQPPYRGGGRRVVDRYRRGGRGNFRNHGRGEWTPRHYQSQQIASALPGNLASAASESVEDVAEASAVNVDQATQSEMTHQAPSVQPNVTTAPQHRIPVARCELCMVDCNSLEILEQHKGGKKHKKNLHKVEAQKAYNVQSTGQDVNDCNNEGKLQLENMQNNDDNKKIIPEIPSETVPVENQPQKPGGDNSCMQASGSGICQSYNQRIGMKRKMRGGHGGNHPKTCGAQRRPKEPKVVIPFICDLCNVKCDTQEVFDRHLSGKKHISKYKRFEGHQAMYGPEVLQVLYPTNPLMQSLSQTQDNQQNFSGPLVSHHNPQPQAVHSVPQMYPPNQAYGNQQNVSNPQGSNLLPPVAHTAHQTHPAETPYGNPEINVHHVYQKPASIHKR